jgi:hypothetical protein
MRELIAEPAQIDATLAALPPGSVAESGRSQQLTDSAGGVAWRLTYLRSERHGSGYRCLIRVPAPAPERLVALAVESPARDEAWAAAVLLSDLPETYPELLVALERVAAAGRWARVGMVIAWSGIAGGGNRRSVVGKHVSEIARDYEFFHVIADRAAALRTLAADHGATPTGEHPWTAA